MSLSTFSGPVRSRAGFIGQGPGMAINIPNGANTLTLDPDLHAGRVLRLNDATMVITLPPIDVTDSDAPNTPNNLGACYEIFIETAATNVKIATNGTDKFVGSVMMVDTDTAGAGTGYAPAASNDNINFNGTTTGGIAGTWVRIRAIAALKYLVEGVVLGSGVVATPFADT